VGYLPEAVHKSFLHYKGALGKGVAKYTCNCLFVCLFVCCFTGDATLSRHKGINIADLHLHTKIAASPSGESWRGRWQKNDIVAKILAVRDCTSRISRDFNEEFPKLRLVILWTLNIT
jgi:hypothetical protein